LNDLDLAKWLAFVPHPYTTSHAENWIERCRQVSSADARPTELGLTKLVNGYFDGNERSWAMQRKLGYRRVGEMPAHCLADGRQTIEHVTTFLRSDWEARAD
jgi:RimJ/RimL family protein N-acetyltransferase